MSILTFVQVVATFPAVWAGRDRPGLVDLLDRDRGRTRGGRCGHLHRAVRRRIRRRRPRMVRPQDVRRQLDVYPVEGQPGRHHPGHLRLVAALPAGDGRAVQPDERQPRSHASSTTTSSVADSPLYMAMYFLHDLFFTYFYVSITFNPQEVADNMKKYGGFIPGIRAGKPTEDYLSYVLSRITLPGALYLGLIALIPLIALVLIDANQNFPFGGTSILIMVGVALDTVKQIESQLQQRNYEGFLRYEHEADPDGASRGREGYPGEVRRRALRDPCDLDRRHLPRQRVRGHRARRRGQALHGRRRLRARRAHQPDGPQPDRRARRRAGLPARRLPAHARPGRGARRDDQVHRAPARRGRGARRSTPTRSCSGSCSAHRSRAAPTTPRTSYAAGRRSTPSRPSRSIDVYRQRGILVEVDGMGEVDDVTGRIFDALDVVAAVLILGAAVPGDRGIELKTPDQIAVMRRAGLLVGETLELLPGLRARRDQHRRARRDRRGPHPRPPARGPRSSATTASPAPSVRR